MVNVDELIKTIIEPLVDDKDDIRISHQETDRFNEYHLHLSDDDVGRVIGKHGHVIQTIRTLVYSVPVSGSKKVRLVVDDGKK
ncbi:KH domain-containing protein [Lentilactobacillus sp. SPB1-3]|uniref:KH domain-containing protein n=1 Tax=Lentilactobacillus terminaliae TaxID=3003483 RepID=A0ACD5DCG0_9LACO|nr:KH domain-containing protein [Lentilactobacillus sp. SPB1-3]MCZ0977186.1 KH domain-containing protein [Lentilactobacillus sp. SPB1-3]